jgi:hypothetical protein
MTKLTAGSVVVHLVLMWAVVYVPAFRDALNIASLIANTRFVDGAYDKTQIRDDITFIDTSEKFRYPDGYFALSDGQVTSELVAGNSVPSQFDPKIISRASESASAPSPSPSPLPSPSPSPSASPATEAIADNKLTPEESQKKLEQTASENNIQLPDEATLNKQALKDFANYVNELKNQGKLDLNNPFEVVIEAELDQNGKLVNARRTKATGDPNLVDLFKEMIAALNDSGFLVYLKPISKDNPNAKVKFTIKQGEAEVLASVESEASSADSARVLSKTLNAILVFGAGSRQGKDEETLMRNTTASTEGKRVVLNFAMPRQTVVELIKKQLEPGL